MKLVIAKAAARRMLALPANAREALSMRLKAIAADPFAPHANVGVIAGSMNTYRLRQGDWRAVYVLDRVTDTMTVTLFDHRREVYR